jgi:opacity protein-like surface antigen
MIYQPQQRTYYKFAFGLDFKYFLTNNISLSFWNGISRRSLMEESYNEFYNSCMGCGGELEKTSEYFSYEQNSYNASIGLNFTEIIRDFRFNMGVELSYLHTGKGKQEYVQWWMEYEDVNLPDSNYAKTNTVISSGNSFGLGINLGMEYMILKNLSLGINFHQYLFYSIFNKKTTGNWTDYRRNLGTETTYAEGVFEIKDNFKQVAFSNILPSIDLRYYFK